jgi:putative YphP/YqiW family bacilliredoxin
MYPDIMVLPMREELTRLGVEELRTAADVDDVAKRPGTTMIVVNSICGCAAGKMRPAVRMALQNAAKPEHSYTVFAGQDKEATERARSYFTGYPPSSPSIGLLRGGKLIYMMQRSEIETRMPQQIAADLVAAFDKFCSATPAAQ